jgi:uncharacterized protein (TIGR00255 family)
MTGFGKSNGVFEGRKRSIEIRSLNGKGLDLTLKIPALYRAMEPEFRALVASTLERGKIDLGLHLEDQETANPDNIDWSLAQGYLKEFKLLASENNLPLHDWLTALTQMPGVVKTNVSEPSEAERMFILSLLEEALSGTQTFRYSEGANLKKDLEQVLETLESLLKDLEPLEQERYANTRQRLTHAMKELSADSVDAGRLEQEVLFYLDKLDVSEEKIRLRSHINYFHETLNEGTSNGKKLGFIVQEMGREINTIGSKSNHAIMQRKVVEMKNHLEKIKEQVQNVL